MSSGDTQTSPPSGSGEKPKTKTLRGKYQIRKNVFVTCYLDSEEATDKGFDAYIGLKKRYDTQVPIGTRLYLNAESINKINERRSGQFDIFSVTVQSVDAQENGHYLHHCTPILRETRPNLRKLDRIKTEIFFTHKATGAGYLAQNATIEGAKLLYKAERPIMSLSLNQQAHFEASYKGANYLFAAEVKHIQYDWKTHAHEVGICFSHLDAEHETILNLLIDPTYKIDLSAKQTVDTSEGKISRND